jgi:4-hydroxy-3-methylbut-2-enyl diphosphate reductase
VGEQHGLKSYLIPGPADIDPQWFTPESVVGVTAGASAPEILVTGVLNRLKELGAESMVEMPAEDERITFPLPRSLRTGNGQRKPSY